MPTAAPMATTATPPAIPPINAVLVPPPLLSDVAEEFAAEFAPAGVVPVAVAVAAVPLPRGEVPVCFTLFVTVTIEVLANEELVE
jgi:hypothetical protein